MRLLLVDFAKAPVADAVDWTCWSDGEIERIENDLDAAAAVTVPQSADVAARRVGLVGHHDALARMVKAVRARNYTIRTEQAYADWLAKFSLSAMQGARSVPGRPFVSISGVYLGLHSDLFPTNLKAATG